MISIGTLMAFGVVCAGVLILRYRDENKREIVDEFKPKLKSMPIKVILMSVGCQNLFDKKIWYLN